MTTTIPANDDQATGVDMMRTIAAALHEGMPSATAVHIYSWSTVLIHTHNISERDQWQGWWEQHGITDWDAEVDVTGQGESITAHRRITGQWRGWSVELVHLTREQVAATWHADGCTEVPR